MSGLYWDKTRTLAVVVFITFIPNYLAFPIYLGIVAYRGPRTYLMPSSNFKWYSSSVTSFAKI